MKVVPDRPFAVTILEQLKEPIHAPEVTRVAIRVTVPDLLVDILENKQNGIFDDTIDSMNAVPNYKEREDAETSRLCVTLAV